MKITLFSLICVMCTFAESASEEKQDFQKSTNTHFMKIREKFDFLFDKVEKFENSTEDTEFNATRIMNAIENILAKMHKFEERFDELDKIPKKIEEVVLSIKEKFDQKINKTRKPEIISELTSQCTSVCESRVSAWTNETIDRFKENLKTFDSCINSTLEMDQKTISDACKPNPCLNGDHCRATSTGRYQCTKCPYPTSGKFCEHLDCGTANQCFQLKGVMYFVYEKRLSWEQANGLCVENGMNLALLQDKGTTDPVMYTLKARYTHYQHACFWLGLKNNGHGQSFRWIDGSAFGGYTGAAKPHGAFQNYSEERCGILVFINGNLLWNPHHCNWLLDPYQMYPLCELHLAN